MHLTAAIFGELKCEHELQRQVMASAAPPALKLTYDILLHVISLFSYAKDAVHLMATCRLLHHAGAKIALRKPVVIEDSEQLASFLAFLSAENSSRCRYLKQLDLWTCGDDEDDIQDLIDILPRLVNIESLRLSNGEDVLEPDYSLPRAFARLASLRHIEFPGVRMATSTLLSLLRSPLVSANIDFIADDCSDIWSYLDRRQWPEYHPVTLLQNFSSTLEELQCAAWYTVTEPAIPKMPIYPNMRKLSLELHDLHLRMDPFIRAFPNLTHLHVLAEDRGPIGNLELEIIRVSHDVNLEKQLVPSGRWAHLEHFTGGVVDLYATGLTCHIRRVTILGTLEDGQATDLLETMLRYARPVHLGLEALAGSALAGFLSMLGSDCASNLINLSVCICFDANDQEKDLRETIVSLCSFLPLQPS